MSYVNTLKQEIFVIENCVESLSRFPEVNKERIESFKVEIEIRKEKMKRSFGKMN